MEHSSQDSGQGGRPRRWFREFRAELRSRSHGRRAMGSDTSTFKAARGIVGATGSSFSGAWDLLDKDGDAYLRSLEREPPLPPSLFVSERDRVRHNQAVPLSERRLEDDSDEVAETQNWDIERLWDRPEAGPAS